MKLGKKFVSLYCGAGGLDLGFISAGFNCIAAFDMDRSAVDVHNLNLGGHASVANLSIPANKVIGALKCADVIVAGPPCQGFSTAGRNNPEDERNWHLSRVAELASESKADVVVIENVKGLLAKKNIQHLARCISILKQSGFAVGYKLFHLSDYGVPQARQRVIVLGSRGEKPISLDALPKRATKTLNDVIGNTSCVGSQERHIRATTERDARIASHIEPGQRLTNVRLGARSVHTWDIPEVFGKTSSQEKSLLIAVSKARRQIRVRDYGDADPVKEVDLARILRANVHHLLTRLTKRGFLRQIGNRYDLTHTFNGKYKRLEWDKCAPTVDTRFIEPRYFLHPEECRGLSIREMAALQEFPSDFVFPDSLAVSSRLIGNAVPPTFGAAIAQQVRMEFSAS